jgi:NAD(P)-dependent dehydrogenase (short-subunit alcohol dehydrogenase family)
VLHNAGSNRRDAFLELDAGDFEMLWREHCLGGFLTGREARGAWCRGAGAQSFSPVQPAHYAEVRALRLLPPPEKAGLRATAQSMARELGPKGIHVAHIVIDCGIEGGRLLSAFPGRQNQKGPEGLLPIEAIADTYWQLHEQQRSAWTHEMDLRPWSERF